MSRAATDDSKSQPEALLRRFAADPSELLNIALGLAQSGEVAKAVELTRAVSRLAPDDPWIPKIEGTILAAGVPRYHLPMVADEERNRAYAAAIERAAPHASHVLDLGTGSGLLARIAARAGAGRVSACEGNAAMAYAAEQIIAANGLSDRIRVLHGHSLDLDPEQDLQGKVDLIVSETFGHDLVGEDGLRSIGDAVARLGTSAVKVIPARAAVMIALASVDEALLPVPAGTVCGLNLTLLNRHRPGYFRIDVDHPGLALASEAAALFDFDLGAGEQPSFGTAILTARAGGANGVVQWIRLQLDDSTSYENRPGPGRPSHWQAIFWPFEKQRPLAAGTRMAIRGWRQGKSLRIWEDAGAEP